MWHAKKSSDEGEWTGTQYDIDHLVYTGCKLSLTGGGCNSVRWFPTGYSATEPPGTINTLTLETYLIDHGTAGPLGPEPIVGEVWQNYQSTEAAFGPPGRPATTWEVFECEPGIVFWVSGALSGVTTPVDLMTRKYTTTFESGQGAQALVFEYNLGGPYEAFVGTGVDIEKAVEYITPEEKVEIRACDAGGAIGGQEPCLPEEPPPSWR